MERKSSINIQPTTINEFYHNARSKPTKNSIFPMDNNYCSLSGKEAHKYFTEDIKKKSKIYTKRTGQKLQKKTKLLFSAVVNLNKHHTEKDVEKIKKYLEDKLDTTIYQIAIHKDEGYVNENGKPHINYHAHIVFSGLDSEGKSVRRKFTKQFLKQLQTDVANLLGMERGQPGKKRLNTYEYKIHAKRLSEEKEKLKKYYKTIESTLKSDLTQLKLLIKKKEKELEEVKKSVNNNSNNKDLKLLETQLKLKEWEIKNLTELLLKEGDKEKQKETEKDFTIKQLKEEISKLRKMMIQANKQSSQAIFTQDEYKYLSELKKSLRASNISEIYDKFLELKEKYEKLMTQPQFSNSIHSFNKKLYVFLKLINQNYKSIEDKNVDLSNFFFKKIDNTEILAGDKSKNLYLKINEKSITANSNNKLSDTELAIEMFKFAKLSGKNILDLEPRGSREFVTAFNILKEQELQKILKNKNNNISSPGI